MIIKPNGNVSGLAQGCSNSSALAMESLQSCTKPSIMLFVANQIKAYIWMIK